MIVLLEKDIVQDVVIQAALLQIGLDPDEWRGKADIIWMMEQGGGVRQVRVELKEAL